MTELLKISDMRNIHKDIPNKVDGAIKYTDGARLGVHSCKIEITDGLLTIDQGELQYGTKRYSIPSYSSAIPYCYSDTLGNVVYSIFDYIPVVWDNPNRLFPTVDPESIPEGYYANLWLYAVLGCDPEDEDEASLMCVLGNTLYLTEREAQSEYLPLTEVTPFGGTVATYNLVGNLVCIGRITTGVLEVGDGPICTYSFSQPTAFSFDVPPVPNIRDIPDLYKYIEGYTYAVTEIDRNRDLAVFHTDGEGGELSTTIVLPEASAFGAGYWLRILSLSTYVGPEGGVNAYLCVGFTNEGASPKIIWHGSTRGTESIVTMQYFASVRLVSNGMDWVATDLSGTWTGDSTYCCDGNIKDGVQDNVVTIDAYGNIQDSGLAASTLAGAEQFIPVTVSPYVVSSANDKGKWVLWGGTGTLNITLPAASAMGSGGWIGAWNFGSGSARVSFNRAGADTLTIGNSTGSATIYSTVKGSYARLVSNGVNGWLLMDASGTWSNATVTRNFDATIPLSTAGNAVTVDAYGDIVDSGYPIITAAAVAAQIEASGGGGGSDMTIYSNIAGDFSAIQAGADTIDIFGLPFSITAVQIKKITSKPTGTAAAVIAARGATLVCTWSPSGSIAGSGTIMTASLGTLATTDEYIIEIEGPPKGYHAATDSTKTLTVGEPAYTNDGVIANLSADTVEVVKSLLADGYNAFSLTATLGAAGDQVTVQGSNDPAGAAGFYDITALALGTNIVSVSGAYQTPDVVAFQWVKFVINGATSASVSLTRFRK